eukprot:Em0008g623a
MASPRLPDKYFCVDVEALATGRGHGTSDRSPCSVVVMGKDKRVLLKRMIRVDKPIVSYLTPLTGVRPGDLTSAPSYEEVVREVKALLGRDAVLVGQSVKSDIEWMQLEQGRDYSSTVELGDLFKTYNPRYGNHSYFTLAHEANLLIREGFIMDQHCPETDCEATLRLFEAYYGQTRALEDAKKKLLARRPAASWAKNNNYKWEGIKRVNITVTYGMEKMATLFDTPTFCIITGGSKGLGREIAIQLAQQWHNSGIASDIVLLSRSVAGMEETRSLVFQSAPSVGLHIVKADMGSLDSLADVFSEAVKHASSGKHGHAMLVHNAGSTGDLSKPIAEHHDPKVVQDYMAANFTSTFTLTALFLSHFKSGNRTVLEINSLLHKKFMHSMSLYSVAKAARRAFMGSLAVENPDVRVVSYGPGACDTDMLRSIPSATYSSETKAAFESYTKTALTCPQSISKLMHILRENRFDNGSYVDYFDTA